MNGNAMEKDLVKTSNHASQSRALKTGTKYPAVANGYPENAAHGSADETLHENAKDAAYGSADETLHENAKDVL